MTELVFMNSKSLIARDIYLAVPVAFVIMLLVKLLYPLTGPGRIFSWTAFLIFGTALAAVWVAKALRETTVKKVEIQLEQEKILFVLQRHFRKDLIISFNLRSVSLATRIKPSKSQPRNRALTIKDENNELELSSRQKGLSEQVVLEIAEKLKHYAQDLAI